MFVHALSENTCISTQCRKTKGKVIPKKQCEHYYGNYITKGHLCTQDINGERGVCHVDV